MSKKKFRRSGLPFARPATVLGFAGGRLTTISSSQAQTAQVPRRSRVRGPPPGALPDFSPWSSRTARRRQHQHHHRARAHPDAMPQIPESRAPDPGIFPPLPDPMPQKDEMPRRGVGSGFHREAPTATS